MQRLCAFTINMITMARPTKSETTVRSMQLRAHDSQTMHGRVPSQSSAQWYYPTKTHPLAVYLIETENNDLLPNESDETDLCCICHLRSKTVTDMLECSRCIGGFHMKCLKPALKSIPKVRSDLPGEGTHGSWDVPHSTPPRSDAHVCDGWLRQGDWMCSACERGVTLPNREPKSACEKFLWGQGLLGVRS